MYNDLDIIYSRFYNFEKIKQPFCQDASFIKMLFLIMNLCFNYKKITHILEYSTNKHILTKNEFLLSAKIEFIFDGFKLPKPNFYCITIKTTMKQLHHGD